MKKLLIVTALVATSTVASAFDYKFNLEGRADFVNADTKTTTPAGVTTTEKWNNFSNGLIRLNMMGTINENLTYRFRYRFIAAAATPTAASNNGRESFNDVTKTNGVDYLYVDHKNSFFTTRFGKQNWVEAAGRESFVAGTDVFLTSAAFVNFRTAFGSDYRYGVSAIYKYADTNTVTLAISNPNSTFSDTGVAASPAAGEKKNTGLAYAAYYSGSFMSKLVQPVLAYSVAKQNGDTDSATKTKDGNNTMWSAGLRSEFSGAIIDADYKALKKADRNDTGTTTLVEEKTKSLYASVAYAVGEFTPIAYYINDKFESPTSATATANFKRNSFAVGTYWKPMADVNFRYHLMYTSAQTKADGSTSIVSKVDDKKIYFGFKADI